MTQTPRHAEAADIPFILDVGIEFHKAAGIQYPLDLASLETSLTNMIDLDDAGLFICGRSAAGAVVTPAWLNYDHRIGQELFFWSPDRNGRKLLAFMEDWARSRGTKHFSMLCMESMRPAAVGKFYERAGYVSTERAFVKEL